MTLESITARLLAGSSYEFEKAVTTHQSGTPEPTSPAADHILAAASHTIQTAHTHGTDWHTHRALETMHHLDWAWRRTTRLNNGPTHQDTP